MHLYQLALQGYEKKQNQTNIIATKTFQDLISLVKDSFIDNFTSFLVLATLFIQKSWYIINNLSNKSQSNYRRSLLRCSLILIGLLFNLEGKRYVKEVCSKKIIWQRNVYTQFFAICKEELVSNIHIKHDQFALLSTSQRFHSQSENLYFGMLGS